MPEDGVETIPEIPTLMKGLEDMDELCLGPVVEVRHDRVQLVDHVVLLLVRLEWPTLDPDRVRPGPEAFVGAGQPPGRLPASSGNNGRASRSSNFFRISSMVPTPTRELPWTRLWSRNDSDSPGTKVWIHTASRASCTERPFRSTP